MSTFSEDLQRKLSNDQEADNRGFGEAVIAMLWFILYLLIVVAALTVGSPLFAGALAAAVQT